MSRRHWSESYSCVCGAKFRSYGAEARHRHNFPILCRKKRVSRRLSSAHTDRTAAAAEPTRAPGSPLVEMFLGPHQPTKQEEN